MKFGKILLVFMLLFSLTACGQTKDTEPSVKNNGEVETAVTEPGVKEAESTDEISETVFFGAYPQRTEKPEPIKWIVLDREADRVLLLASECIDSRPWHSSHENITWDSSDLRVWLNTDFLQAAFTDGERSAILRSDLDNGDDWKYGTPVGENTQDKVFLLSGAEIDKYLPSQELRTVQPTDYAISHDVYTNDKGNCAWWLRSPGMTKASPAYIASPGNIGNRAHKADETIIGVRPAIWVLKERLQ